MHNEKSEERMKKMGKNQKREPIEKRLVKSFGITSATTAFAAVLILVVLIITSLLYSNALTYYGFAQGDIGRAMTDFSETRSSTRMIIGYDDMEIVENAKTTHDEKKADFEAALVDVEAGIATEAAREQFDQLEGLLQDYWELDDYIIETGSTNEEELYLEAQRLAASELAPKYEEINGILQNMMDIKVNTGDQRDAILNKLMWAVTIGSVALIVFSMVSAVRKGKKIAKQISSSLEQVSARLEAFADGDLSSDFPEFTTNDEINDMAVSAERMADNLKNVLHDIDVGISAIAKGDFTITSSCPERYLGEFKSLKESVGHLETKMKETMLQIEAASNQVESGSKQLADSATSLAEGALEQAGSVEELTATIEDISAQSAEAAKQIEEAYKKGVIYREKAEESKEDVAKLVEAMKAISNVSMEISDIIGDIENIAAQTNLLSLNASIEAARAGEAGKGFAVVASQIGTLASNSAQSAVHTRELIQNALEEVERGNEVMEETSEALQEVVEGIVFLSNASKEASEISYNNVNTMHEIEDGIEQISGVVQTNSSSAEQTSSTSQELAAQATTLKGLVGQFVLA
jgi:methyl-accepting chemotaxis protein